MMCLIHTGHTNTEFRTFAYPELTLRYVVHIRLSALYGSPVSPLITPSILPMSSVLRRSVPDDMLSWRIHQVDAPGDEL